MIRTRVVDADSWHSIADVLGPNGASQGCWCTFWRLTNQEAAGNSADDNRAVLQEAVLAGEPVGALAFDGDEPVGWCSVAPRNTYKRLFRHTAFAPMDDDPGVWSVVCVFTRKGHRRKGVAAALVEAAVDYAREAGATRLESYPLAQPGTSTAMSSGTIDLYAKAGFTLLKEPPGRRVIMTLSLA